MEFPRTGRRSFAALAALSLLAARAPAVLAQAAKAEKTKVSIAVGSLGAFHYLPLTVAGQLGYFRAEGLEVELHDAGGGLRALQALQDGQHDVAGGAVEDTIALQGKNKPYRSFVLMSRAPQIALGISTRALPAYKSARDLKGRSIGVAQPGFTANLVLGMVLARVGMSGADVELKEMGSSAVAVAALRAGQVDAIAHAEPVMSWLEQRREVRIVTDTRTLKGTQEVFGGPMPAACLYASADYVQKNPQAVQALANAVVHALKWLQTAGPSDLVKVVPESYLMGDRSLYLAAFDKIREAIAVDGLIPEEGMRTALRALARMDASLQADKIDLARSFTNEFARKAKEKFRA